MAIKIGDALLKLGVDSSELDAGMNKAVSNIKSQMKVAGLALTGLGVAITGVAVATTKMAMDTVESENLFTVAMGNMRDSARAWSEELSDSLGLNEFELRKNISTLYQMTSSMGLGSDAAYDMSKGLTQLAYDMASFYNLRPEEAFLKLQAGISGEAEPLKRLGILIDENTIKTVAYTTGIAEQGEELTQQQKIQARYQAILQQTANAQGDLARTLDSPTNQLRILKTQIEETATKIGMNFLPVLQKLLEFIKPIIDGFKDWIDRNPKLVQALSLAALAVGVVSLALGGLLLILPSLTAAIGTLGITASLALGGLPIIIGAITTAGVLLWQNWDKVSAWLQIAWANIKLFFLEGVESILSSLERFTSFIPWLGDKVSEARESISNMVEAERVKKDLLEVEQAIKDTGDALADTNEILGQTSDSFTQSTDATKEQIEVFREWREGLEANKKALEEQNEAAQSEHEKLLKRAAEKIKQYQYEQSVAGKLRITTDDVTDVLISQGWTTEKLAELWKQLGDDVDYADLYLQGANLTIAEVVEWLEKQKDSVDGLRESYKKLSTTKVTAPEITSAQAAAGAHMMTFSDYEIGMQAASMGRQGYNETQIANAVAEMAAGIPTYAQGGPILEDTLLLGLKSLRPYAVAHEGEKVSNGASVVITGNTFNVRQESDIDRIGEALVNRMRAMGVNP